ncbi:X-ray radiation resistance-associated protein 1 [Geranomyces michiganensis]|nr:X-ray radiation resistance-associated protein 1 [Geranomyces michiganensis]
MQHQPAHPRGGGGGSSTRQQVASHPHKLTFDAPSIGNSEGYHNNHNPRDADATAGCGASPAATPNSARRPGDLTQKRKGKYVEIPQVLDGFFMLNKAPADDPENVYLLDITGENLCLVIEDDLTMFTNLQTLRCGENSLPFAKLGVLPGLRKLAIPCNGLTDLDLEVEGRYLCLEHLDVSYNRLTPAAIIVLASLPSLRSLDLSTNNLSALPDALIDMTRWRDRVIESILPKEELDALEGWMTRQEAGEHVTTEIKEKSAINSAAILPRRAGLKEMMEADVPITLVSDETDTGAAAGEPTANEDVQQLLPQQNSESSENHPQQADIAASPAAASLPDEPRLDTGHRLMTTDEELAVVVNSDDEGSIVESAADENDDEVGAAEASQNPTAPTDISMVTGGPALPSITPDPEPLKSVLAQQPQDPPSFNIEDHQFTALPPGWQVPAASPGGPGFRRLEVLTLDNNRINTLAAFQILDLDITFNQIGTPDALLGIAALPALEKVFLEGNPIMQRKAQKMAVREEGDSNGEVLGYIEFDPLVQLPGKYHIEIADAIYHTVRASSSGPETNRAASASATPAAATTTAATPSVTTSHPARPIRYRHYGPTLPTYHTTTAASRFLSHMRRTSAPPPTIAASRFATPRAVADISPLNEGESGAQRRRRRREYDFTDHDLEEIVRRGYIPDVAELVQFAEERGREADGYDDDFDGYHDSDDLNHRSDKMEVDNDSDSGHRPEQLHYDRSAHDATFLTGVHITTTAGDGITSTRSSLLSHPAGGGTMYPARTPTPDSAADDDPEAPPLPATLPASIRALRAALAACVSRPAALPKGYAAQTQASAAMAAVATATRRGGRGRNHKKGDAGVPWSTLDARSRPPGQLPRISGHGGGAGGDEFSQIRRIVKGLNQRIQIVEENLAVLMDPKRPSPLASAGALLPPSRKLLKRVQDEYARVERMYAAAALAQKGRAPEAPTAEAERSTPLSPSMSAAEVAAM